MIGKEKENNLTRKKKEKAEKTGKKHDKNH